jgi:hypothetical protein
MIFYIPTSSEITYRVVEFGCYFAKYLSTGLPKGVKIISRTQVYKTIWPGGILAQFLTRKKSKNLFEIRFISKLDSNLSEWFVLFMRSTLGRYT